jgi:hypothetical protein
MVARGQNNEVNDYLVNGWILLEVTKDAAKGDAGDRSWPVYHVGWIGKKNPQFPAPHPPSGGSA